ncbi:MAG: extracellular solute-binding protein [Alphaproteobacteria bacterium]|nr:extracellular solute-binding protein [Alphaproteobacteria bacterium]
MFKNYRISLFLGLCFFVIFTAASARAENLHGLALHEKLKYAPDFTHFDYANPEAPKGGVLRLATIGGFDTLNPYTLKGRPAAESSLVFETLMESALDEPFSQYGRIAQSVTVAPDKSWVSYVLRDEARFNDGMPIRCEDVVFSFEVLRDKGHPFYRSYYKDVAKAECLSPHNVKFTFHKSGNAELPLIIGQMLVFSKSFWQGKDFAATTLEPILSSGPYQIEQVTPGRSITYKRVSDWWGKDLPVNKGRYNFDRITVDYYRDATVALEGFFAGKYDYRFENIAKNWATAYTSPAVKQGHIIRAEIPNALPAGMQGFFFNIRRPIFKDPRVRQAITLAFDFEWGNKTLAYGAYSRTKSYFANAELAAIGLPSPEELKLLEPFRDQLPKEVFEQVYEPPQTDGSGDVRDNLLKASTLLEQAGWVMKNGKRVDQQGNPLTFEILESSNLFERWVQPFLRNLERLGIKANLRIVDTAQYQNLMDSFDFDMTTSVFGQSLSPGNEQLDFWSSAKADQKGSRNIIGIKDPVVDALIEKLIHAQNRSELITATRALDRVLLWGHYVIPHWNSRFYRIAYWDKFGQPALAPKYGLDITSLWWFDQNKVQKLESGKKTK